MKPVEELEELEELEEARLEVGERRIVRVRVLDCMAYEISYRPPTNQPMAYLRYVSLWSDRNIIKYTLL